MNVSDLADKAGDMIYNRYMQGENFYTQLSAAEYSELFSIALGLLIDAPSEDARILFDNAAYAAFQRLTKK